MFYRLIQRINPRDLLSPRKWFAVTVNNGRITEKDLGIEIASRSSLSRGDVANVIINVIDAIPKYLLMGKSVSLGELGILRLSFSSEGVDSPDDFSVNLIKGIRIIFTPSPELKEKIQNVKFERKNE